MRSSIRVEIKKAFPSPLTGHRTKVGEEVNVPHNQFWLKRIDQGDCEKVKTKKVPKKLDMKVGASKSVKGSK